MPMGDLVIARHSSGMDNIEFFMRADGGYTYTQRSAVQAAAV